jgi:predicted nucleic acid-binding protein
MSSFLADTNCLVAAVCSWHDHHRRAKNEMDRRLAQGEALVIAAPSLVEAYSVLTRLPAPRRLSADEAFALLSGSFFGPDIRIVALNADDYGELLRESARGGIIGGRVYDGVIARCAVAARVDVLLTFNDRDFRGSVSEQVQVVVPAEP